MSRSRRGPALLGVVMLAIALVACGAAESDRRSSVPPTSIGARSLVEAGRDADVSMRVDAAGFVPDEWLNVTQCRLVSEFYACGLYALEVHADAAGTWNGAFSPRQWIFTAYGWVDCITEPCVVKVAANSDRVVRTTAVELSGASAVPMPTPAMSVEPPGPYVAGQLVTVAITDAPPGLAGSLTVCTKVPLDSAHSGWCAVGGVAGFFTTDAAGAATLVDYRLPGLPCEPAASCELAWYPGYDHPPIVSQDIDYL